MINSDDEKIEQMMSEAWAVVRSEGVSVKDLIGAFDVIEDCNRIQLSKDIEKIELAVGDADRMKKVIYSVMVDTIKLVRQYRDKEYSKSDELRSKGVGFGDRMKSINFSRIDFCNQYEKKLIADLKVFQVRPLSEWVTRFDIDMARKWGKGFQWIIKTNLDRCYFVPQKK